METPPLPDLLDCVYHRKSVRAFIKNRPLPNGLLQGIIKDATRAPSSKNVQAYHFYAVSGEAKVELSKRLVQRAEQKATPEPEVPYDKRDQPELKNRAWELGMALYRHLGIDRKDKEAREKFNLRNFTGFDAPTLLFCYIPRTLEGWAILDLGLVLGHLILLCEREGLGTCLQASLASYPDIVREFTGAADDEKLVVGLSVGYPDSDAVESSFSTGRVSVERVFTSIDRV